MLHKLRKIAKLLLAKPAIRKTYQLVMRVILEIFTATRFLSVIFHWFRFTMYRREQFAVLSARRNYFRNMRKSTKTHPQLRRNTHRLEKGILMRPRRPVFARDYIGETVEFYEQAVAQFCADKDSLDVDELDWAHNVLDEYFTIVKPGQSEVIDAARARFEATQAQYVPGELHKVPYERAASPQTSITYEQMLELAMRRRSVRWFKDQKVPRDLIDKAILVGRQSPTACNRSPYEYRIFDDPKMVKAVAGLPFGAAGYSHNIPTIVVVVGKLSSYFSPRDRHLIYIDASLANMGFMYALETLGLASSPINWPDFEPLERRMAKMLNLANDERVVMLMAVGYPDPKGLVAFSQKKSLDVLRRFNDLGRDEESA